MKLTKSIHRKDASSLLRQLRALGTPVLWHKRERVFHRQVEQNQFIQDFLEERFSIELTMARCWQYERSTGRIPRDLDSPALHRLFEFAAALTQIYGQLSPPAQKRLVGRLQDGLKSDVGLSPLRFELQMAMNTAMAGFEFDCADLENGGGFDLLIRPDGAQEVEVECQTFSADLGRCVHKRRLFELGHRVIDQMSYALGSHGSLFLDVQLSQHLSGRMLEQVTDELKRTLASGTGASREGVCSIDITSVSNDEFPSSLRTERPDEDSVREFVEQRFQIINAATLVVGGAGNLLIVSVRGTKPDRLADAMYRELKRGAKQLSGNRPGILRAHLLDITAEELLSLHESQQAGRPSLLNAIATRLFSESRSHLFGVSFSTPGVVLKRQQDIGRLRHTITREESPSYCFQNRKHALANDLMLQRIL